MWIIRILVIGKTKNRFLKGECERLISMINKDWALKIVYKPSVKAKDEKSIKRKETLSLLEEVKENKNFYVLSERGRELTSLQFYEILKGHKERGERIDILIGGSYGLDEELIHGEKMKISLSKMTLSHEFALTFLVEQIYRAYTFYYNIPYSK